MGKLQHLLKGENGLLFVGIPVLFLVTGLSIKLGYAGLVYFVSALWAAFLWLGTKYS